MSTGNDVLFGVCVGRVCVYYVCVWKEKNKTNNNKLVFRGSIFLQEGYKGEGSSLRTRICGTLTVPWRAPWDWDRPAAPVCDTACDRSAGSRGTRSPACRAYAVWTSCRWSTAGRFCKVRF